MVLPVNPAMSENLIVQMPADAPGQLFLLFHGVGSTPHSLLALGRRLAESFPGAAVVSVAAPDRSDTGGPDGRQWFSVRGITEENRAERVTATMPRYVETVRALQRDTGTSAAQTALIGFSQGGIMALESTQVDAALAGRVVSLAGRFARLPEKAPAETTLHFIHGRRDAVISYEHTVKAAEHLVALGGDLTADVVPGLGHVVDEGVGELLLKRLTTHVPKRLWELAMREAGGPG